MRPSRGPAAPRTAVRRSAQSWRWTTGARRSRPSPLARASARPTTRDWAMRRSPAWAVTRSSGDSPRRAEDKAAGRARRVARVPGGRGGPRACPPAAYPKGRLVMEFPIRYWGWAYKGGTRYRVIVRVAAPGERTTQERTNHAYANEAQARPDVEQHNRSIG